MQNDHDSAAEVLPTAQAEQHREAPLRPTQALIDALRRATRDGVLDTVDNPAHHAIAAHRPRPSQPGPEENGSGSFIEP